MTHRVLVEYTRDTMLLDGNFHDEDFNDPPAEPPAALGSRPVPGLIGLAMGIVKPQPYPFNIYLDDDVSWSGVVGTMLPSGEVELLDLDSVENRRHHHEPPKLTRYWDERLAAFVEGELVWDGVVAGSYDGGSDEEPARRLWDASITGMWPNHPPRAERIVNPEKAREAYAEAERDRQEWN